MTLLDQPVGQLARQLPGATRVFHDYGIDFCCGGRATLRDSFAGREADLARLVAALEALPASQPGERDWQKASIGDLVDHILARYHAVHRQQLPELIRLARRVEHVHGERGDCPSGLAEHLEVMHQELESHMQKEEMILFPLLKRGSGHSAHGPIAVMRFEHDEHGEALARLMALTHDIQTPKGACTTWRALYAGLREFREDLMQHIHLENNVLFERAASEPPVSSELSLTSPIEGGVA
ncbi:regulator of cell morphogenesis and NO signaling [Modicisalibacter xianhensis]|uniref:Regulator of cell morphogenesis and NO signaling n=1 Tax=Modicisalibacter xianhensis TaxID=442341 RepID=A0A4R8FZ68_9GAMM|nr:iron-sulfur cluster repair protein YtfE [Halomonas xianhensis]TDX29450.1 regulator of cell morphogenesis and NO signaling [Halomonas xianhensis]